MAVWFDEKLHEYGDGRRKLPSVTGILRAVGLYSDYGFAASHHKFRGRAVHQGCAMIDQGVDPHLTRYPNEQLRVDIEQGYWAAYRKFKARTNFQGRIYECPFVDPVGGYGGTPDVVGECDDEIWSVDLKSGTLPELVPIQLAAYRDLMTRGIPINAEHPGIGWLRSVIESGRPILHKAVRLQKDGTDTLYSATTKGVSYDSPIWAARWRGALAVYQTRAEYGLL
jgi:hypothetical protein